MVIPAGVTHITNIKGSKGDKGDTGTFASIESHTLPAGTPASAEMVGPPEFRGLKLGLPRGLPGVNAVENDAATAAYIDADDTETRAALTRSFARGVSVTDPKFGAVGDGLTDDTSAIQLAIDSGAATVHFPPGVYKTTGTIVIRRGVELTGFGATLDKSAGGAGWHKITFAILPPVDNPGGVVSNVRVVGFTLVGNLAEYRAAQLAWVHRGHGIEFINVNVYGAQTDGHALDLQGCSGVRVIECGFYGARLTGLSANETIQIDASYRDGAPSHPLKAAEVFDGSVTRDVLVTRCKFGEYQGYRGARPIGSHSNMVGSYFENIRFVENTVGRLANFDSPVIVFNASSRTEVIGNTFNLADDTYPNRRLVTYTTTETGITFASVNDESASSDYWPTPMLPKLNVAAGNHVPSGYVNNQRYWGHEVEATLDSAEVTGSVTLSTGRDTITARIGVTLARKGSISGTTLVIGHVPKGYEPVRQVWTRVGFALEGTSATLTIGTDGAIALRSYQGDDQPVGANLITTLSWARI